MAAPADGVYAGWLSRCDSGEPMPAAISVGTNPTFDGIERRVESYVITDQDLQLYGVECAVQFIQRIRGQVKFSSVEELVDQMTEDVTEISAVLDRTAK
jgi:riboflavin kinase/FMN adenylyltransferase